MSEPAWSFSSLSAFEQCPLRYKLTRVSKAVKEPQTEATLWGNRVHKALELRIRDGAPLPATLAGYETIAAKIANSKGEILVEQKVSVNASYKPTAYFAKDVWCRGVLDVAVVGKKRALILDWKGLALNTKLPTPTGWTTMGEVSEGDELIGADGRPCRVIGKSEVHNRKCYRLTFDDKTTVVCDDEHLWEVNGEVLSTKEVASTLLRYGQKWRTVRLTGALSLPSAELPIHPYVLGLWLADGKHTSGEVCKPDGFVWDKVQSLGYTIGNHIGGERCRAHTIKGIRGALTGLGVLGNKHIPQSYLRAATSQRISLLQGLMDGDGNVNSVRKQAVFTSCDKTLSDNVMELLCSLGQRPLQSTTTQRGFGKTVTAYPISFRPLNNLNPFTLPRKADRVLSTWGDGHSHRRLIDSVDEVPSVPTQCIAVDSHDNTYLCTEKFLVTHNTGKRKDDLDQLKLFAGMAFAHHPEVDVVDTGFVWLKDNVVDRESFTRKQVGEIWGAFIPRVQRLNLAFENDRWPANPSGLCRNYCPVGKSQCDFCGKQ